MKQMREVYEEKHCWGWYDYQPMIEAFGEVLVQVEDRYYQGDTRVLLEQDGKLGHLVFGWGSCSGCDALQGCETIEEVQELADYIYNSIVWFDSKEECLKYFNEHDWEGDYSWHQEETHEYIEQVKNFLTQGDK